MKSKYFIISAPSGSGKSSLANYLLSKEDSLAFSISSTTRNRREKEINGVDYYFISKEQFKEHIKLKDDYKGTLKSEINRLVNLGKNIIFDVDVVGGLNLKKYFGEEALSIFIDVPSVEALEERLKSRGSEGNKEIRERINKARFEITKKELFDVILMNDDLSVASPKILKLVKSFLIR